MPGVARASAVVGVSVKGSRHTVLVHCAEGAFVAKRLFEICPGRRDFTVTHFLVPMVEADTWAVPFSCVNDRREVDRG